MCDRRAAMTPFDRNKRFFFYFEQIGTVQQGLNGDSGTNDPPVDFAAKQHELQTIIEKQTSELSQWQRRVSDLNGRINELEDTLSKNTKDYGKAQDHCVKLQRDLRENVAQKEDQEERIATLEKRYLHAQRESTSLHDLNEKLEQELRHKEAQLKVLVLCVCSMVSDCLCFTAARREDLCHSGEAGALRPETCPMLQTARDRGAIEGSHGGADAGRKSGRQGRKDD